MAIQCPFIPRISHGVWETRQAVDLRAIWDDLAKVINFNIPAYGTLAELPDWTIREAGRQYYVTDYEHMLYWDGAAWTWAQGEIGSGYYAYFEGAPNTVGANAWALANGATVAKLNPDGTTTNVVMDNNPFGLGTTYFRR